MTDPLGDLADRVKALERWKNTHSNLIEHDHLDDFNNRMKALEELQKKVKDLESKNIDGQYELHTCALEEHNKRLKNLEEWKKSTGGSILARIKFLEEWKQGVISARQERLRRLEKLEEWQMNHHFDNIVLDKIYGRIKDLEEWKQKVECRHNEIVSDYVKKKVIDKKVWDEIKQFVSKIGFLQPSDYFNLRDVVEKAEGGEI